MGKLKLVFAVCLVFALAVVASAQDFEQMLKAMDARLAGSNLAVLKVEVLTMGSANEVGKMTVYQVDRFQLLDAQWAPGDPRRNADGNNITYLIDPNYMVSSSGLDLEAINDTTFQTWQGEVASGKLNIVKRPYPATNPNFVYYYFFGGPPADPFQADIVTTGFLPVFAPGSSTLGVTWTFIWTNGGVPTDINHDGFADIALKEIWYNDNWNWVEGGAPGIDFESVCLHENGHGLGLAHFGMIFTNPSGKLHVSPRAVMNAFYLGIIHMPRTTDHSAINHIYNNWPH